MGKLMQCGLSQTVLSMFCIAVKLGARCHFQAHTKFMLAWTQQPAATAGSSCSNIGWLLDKQVACPLPTTEFHDS